MTHTEAISVLSGDGYFIREARQTSCQGDLYNINFKLIDKKQKIESLIRNSKFFFFDLVDGITITKEE